MELLFITLADFAQVINGKTYLMGGGWDTLTIPTQQAAGSHVAYIALAISVGWAEMAKEHGFTLDLEQSGQRVGQVGSGKFTVPKPPGDVYLKHRTFMVAFPIELSLAAGDYRVKLAVDGRDIGEVRYGVVSLMANIVPLGTPRGFVGSS